MSDQSFQLATLNLDSLSFDSFSRNPAVDVVCLAPIRTIIRREEEITLVRKVRKVEEIEAGLACPAGTAPVGDIPLPSTEPPYTLYVDANAGLSQAEDQITDRTAFVHHLWENNKLPAIANDRTTAIRVKLDVEGQWNYGPNEFSTAVGVAGNRELEEKERNEGDMLFPGIRPAALVAFKISDQNGFTCTPVAYGEYLNQEITLQPGERLYFINNDQPGWYHDNSQSLTVKWQVVS